MMSFNLGYTQKRTALTAEQFRPYIDKFNRDDHEIYKEFISNTDAWDFLKSNIPLFECPDKSIEKTYYFRWWTYRKHIKKTPEGYVITEFLPNVPWAGKDNAISCPAALHFYEGRWLKDQSYLNSYANYWFHRGGSPRSYSFWPADALYNDFLVTGKDSLCKTLLPDLIKNYAGWEKDRLDKNGLFWQIDDRDGMEVSACGTGYRATINAYMYGEAKAIAQIALMSGQKQIAGIYESKAIALKNKMQQKLWDTSARFFKMLPRDEGATLCNWRELYGYTPWYFNMPDSQYAAAWKFLMDPKAFYAPYGPTTLEQSSPKFKISYQGHECQWNGPSWPYATSITLTGLANLLNNYAQPYISKADYLKLLSIYTNSQQLKSDDGITVPWIDEDLNPFTGDWISRTRLKTWKNGTWSKDAGGEERGKDYNHSTYCDLIISGLIGLRPQAGDKLVINPLLPAHTWKYFCLDHVWYHGKTIMVMYDQTGGKYHRGQGFFVFVNGEKKAFAKELGRLEVKV